MVDKFLPLKERFIRERERGGGLFQEGAYFRGGGGGLNREFNESLLNVQYLVFKSL